MDNRHFASLPKTTSSSSRDLRLSFSTPGYSLLFFFACIPLIPFGIKHASHKLVLHASVQIPQSRFLLPPLDSTLQQIHPPSLGMESILQTISQATEVDAKIQALASLRDHLNAIDQVCLSSPSIISFKQSADCLYVTRNVALAT